MNFGDLLSSIRFPGDEAPADGALAPGGNPTSAFLLNDLLVQPAVVPGVSSVLSVICDRLEMDRACLQAFVYASPYLQAECYGLGEDRAVIRLSSALIEALNDDELMFVIGHEIGHFLLKHLWGEAKPAEGNLEVLLTSRRRELSVDRVGLLACRDLPAALSAMMKTMSGLSERHLKLDVANFVSQLRSIERDSANFSQAMATHPAFIIRCRALLWFSMNGAFQVQGAPIHASQLEEINRRVDLDLVRFVDTPVLAEIDACASDFAFWSLAHAVTKRGVFAKTTQCIFTERFGSSLTNKLKVMLGSLTVHEASARCSSLLVASREKLAAIAPRRLEKELLEVELLSCSVLGET